MRRTLLITAATAAAALTTVGLVSAPGAGAVGASGGSDTSRGRVLTTDVLAPFQMAATAKGAYVADGFKNNLSLLGKDGSLSVVAEGTGSEIGGVDVSPDGTSIAWLSTTFPSGPGETFKSSITIRTQGKKDVVANLGKYEKSMNPDRGVTYGIVKNGNPCAREALKGLTGGPATYKGLLDSHPYAVASWGGGWIVADAAGNDLLKVDAKGNISTLAVLPAQPVTFTAEMAAAVGAPDCVVGVTYAFESVPTDVEVDYQGNLVVTTLPGGPESPALGARGSVWTLNPTSGALKRLATGFLGATNAAIGPDGVYVAELFAGKITKVDWSGRKSLFTKVANPLSLEVRGGTLYAGTLADIDMSTGQVNGPGSIRSYWIL